MPKMMTLEETREFCALVDVRVALAAGVLMVDDDLLLASMEDAARDTLQALGGPAHCLATEVRHAVMLARDGHFDGLFS